MAGDDAPDTVTEAVQMLNELGYGDELEVVPEGVALRSGDGVEAVTTAVVDYVFRFEGPSDPGDETIVLGVNCPTLNRRGVVVSAYGPAIDADHDAVLHQLLPERR